MHGFPHILCLFAKSPSIPRNEKKPCLHHKQGFFSKPPNHNLHHNHSKSFNFLTFTKSETPTYYCSFRKILVFLHRIMDTTKTEEQFKSTMSECRNLFMKKLHDYGASWRILRPSSLTDQLFIKAKRIRSIETKGEALVDEGIRPEFVALINYGIIGLIQLEKGYVDSIDITPDEAMKLYDTHAQQALELMTRKNHDYDEAWRSMRISSYTDFILTKLQRIKEIEDLNGATLVSEGIDANYMDIINYAVFGVIKLTEQQQQA